MVKRRYNPHALPPWLRYIRGSCCQFIIPLCVFQVIRTIILPTTFDALLLTILILLALAFQFDMI
ncbi:hypothetical protein [Bacillus sp. 1NLA3E]|jgi:hypothetical protein|uniref:hypothetical protein n=1 Tax=Bacillus sp. 1NLA3E TaxID=666686 RepID=UPI000247EB06|nr:hypothetical protein [Bacillus sp. 1NLA3E]